MENIADITYFLIAGAYWNEAVGISVDDYMGMEMKHFLASFGEILLSIKIT
jgi:hypothetical protein